MTTTIEEQARAALRERQGAGARYDSPDAPAHRLAWARRGTAYFARVLANLADDELYGPSLLPGWTRAHVVAHVGYNARALTRLVQWARTGVETPMYGSPAQRGREIERGSTLPAQALRNLFAHAAVHLDVEWRDVAQGQWDNQFVTAQGRTVPLRETAWMRTREVWVHAVDLAAGGSFVDVPTDVRARWRPARSVQYRASTSSDWSAVGASSQPIRMAGAVGHAAEVHHVVGRQGAQRRDGRTVVAVLGVVVVLDDQAAGHSVRARRRSGASTTPVGNWWAGVTTTRGSSPCKPSGTRWRPWR